MMERKKALELDKICRVCICERKDMRPLFSEKVAEMLMEFANVSVTPTEGWPDKICVQCVHAVSRSHAFKMQVERSDKELREYIRSLTVRLVMDDKPPRGSEISPVRLQQATRVVLDEAQGLKLQQSQAKLLELQQQQQLLLQQQQEQQQLKIQQQKQQKLLQKQLKQQQQQQQQLLLEQQQKEQQEEEEKQKQQQLLQQHQQQQQLQQQQQQQLQHQQQQQQQQQQLQQQLQQQQQQLVLQNTKRKASPMKRLQSLAKKSPAMIQIQQQQQHQQQQTHQLIENIPQQQQLQSIITNQPTLTLSEAVSIQNNRLHTSQALLNPPQLIPISNSSNNNHNNATLTSNATNTGLPQQILLPNGQIITTTQILATNANGQHQLAQIITNPAPPPPQPQQHQYAPQLIQTTSGQTLQLIQQLNGQQILQLVQIVPQRTTTGHSNNSNTTTILDEEHLIVEEDVLMEQSEQHLIDDDDDDEDSANTEQICETIVVDEDQLHISQQHAHAQLLQQNDDLEYLEDVTVTTSGQQHQSHSQSQFILPDVTVVQEIIDEDELDEHDDDIIEEIQMEEEMLDDPMLLDASDGSEFMSEHAVHHHMIDGDDMEQRDYEDNSLTHYTVVESCVSADPVDVNDVDALEEAEVNAVFQAACDANESEKQHIVNSKLQTTTSVVNSSPPKKSGRRANSQSNRTLANTRQLQATACSIAQATAQDDDFEIDSKLIADFISQQTTVLGSGRYKCNLCQQEFKQFKGLQNHMHSHSNWIRANCKKQPQCEICQKSFKGPGMLRMHMKTHQSAGKIPTCQICNKAFKSKAILYRHRQTHQQRSYSCAVDNCRKQFSTAVTLKAHIERKHPNTSSSRKYKCGECNSVYFDVEALEEHLHLTGHGGDSITVTAVAHNQTTHNLSNIQNQTTLPTTVTMTEVVGGNGDVYIVTQA